MADNVGITTGSDATVATDEVSSAHYQRVKLVDGTLDSTTAIAAGGGTEAGALRVTIANDSTGIVSVDDNGGALTVDGTVTAELSATDNAVLDAIALAVATEGDALADGILIQGDDGTDRTNILVDTAGHLQVDAVTLPGDATINLNKVAGASVAVSNGTADTSLRVTVASDSTGQVKLAAGTAEIGKLAAGTAEIGYAVAHGLTAHDGAITEATAAHQPVRIGAKSLNGPTAVTDVSADADAVSLLATRGGLLYVNTAHPNFWSAIGTSTTAESKEVKAYPNNAALAHYITDVIVSNGATAGSIIIQADTGSAKTSLIGPLYLAANGGAVINLRTPIRATTNKNVGYTSTTMTTVSVTISGFTAA